MTDLAARVLAAIEQAELRLRIIGGRPLSDVELGHPVRTLQQHTALIARAFESLPTSTTVTTDEVDAILTWILPEADRQIVDVDAGLRHCAADRKIAQACAGPARDGIGHMYPDETGGIDAQFCLIALAEAYDVSR